MACATHSANQQVVLYVCECDPMRGQAAQFRPVCPNVPMHTRELRKITSSHAPGNEEDDLTFVHTISRTKKFLKQLLVSSCQPAIHRDAHATARLYARLAILRIFPV
jgi:hypothetical protein